MQATQVSGTLHRRSFWHSAEYSVASSGMARPYMCCLQPTTLQGLIWSGKRFRFVSEVL